MKLKAIRIVVVLVILFLPSVTTLDATYKDSLWTSDTFRKRPTVLADYNYTIGHVAGDTKDWVRFRLGFPVKPITIDVHGFDCFQIRFETQYFIYSVVVVFVALGLFLLVGWFNGTAKSTA